MIDENTNQARHCVCRCEEVNAAEIRQAIAAGARTINDVKRRTRAGMGLCQGVYCLEHVGRILATEIGATREDIVPMTARPPVRLLTLAALAGEDPPT
jgi:NAD(P)H-nitrite reductase large subunit